MIFIDVTSNVEVGEVRCVGPMSVAPSFRLLLLFLQWQKWAKKGSYGEISFNGELWFHGESSFNGELWFYEQFWQRQDTCDCGCEIRCLHHLFIIGNHAVLGLGFVDQGFSFLGFADQGFSFLGFFPLFPHYFIFFFPFRVFLLFWRNFGYFQRKRGFYGFLEAF